MLIHTSYFHAIFEYPFMSYSFLVILGISIIVPYFLLYLFTKLKTEIDSGILVSLLMLLFIYPIALIVMDIYFMSSHIMMKVLITLYYPVVVTSFTHYLEGYSLRRKTLLAIAITLFGLVLGHYTAYTFSLPILLLASIYTLIGIGLVYLVYKIK